MLGRAGLRCHSDTVAAGGITGLLGPNGAGKTTIVHILSTLVRPDGGTAFVNGCDVPRDPGGVRAVVGLPGQFSAVDRLLSGEENLPLMARLRHLGAGDALPISPTSYAWSMAIYERKSVR